MIHTLKDGWKRTLKISLISHVFSAIQHNMGMTAISIWSSSLGMRSFSQSRAQANFLWPRMSLWKENKENLLIVYDTWCPPKRVFFIYKNKYKKMPKPNRIKVENILKGTLDSIPSPSPLVKSQIMCGKVWLRCKGKTLLGVVNKFLKTKSLLTSPSNVLPYYLK